MSGPSLAISPRRSIGIAGLLLAALVLAAFWPVASGARNFFHLDLRYEHLPVWDVTQQALRAGQSPFWIDGEYAGHPLLFHQEAPLFYPPTAPLLLTGAPVERLSDLFTLFHYWLAGFAAYLLLADLEADDFSALFGGVAWMLSARLVQSAIWPNAVAVSALLPLGLLGIFRIGRGRRRSGVPIAACAGGLALLAARPHVLLGAAPLLSAAAVAAVLAAKRPVRAAADLTLAAGLALALGGASLVPSAALYPEMSRAGGLSRSDRDVNPVGIGEGLDLVFLPVDGGTRWPEAAAYPGLAAGLLFLAGLALADEGRPIFRVRCFWHSSPEASSVWSSRWGTGTVSVCRPTAARPRLSRAGAVSGLLVPRRVPRFGACARRDSATLPSRAAPRGGSASLPDGRPHVARPARRPDGRRCFATGRAGDRPAAARAARRR